MKKTLTAAAVVLAVLGSTGTASAELIPGKAYGNCGHNAVHGDREAARGQFGSGNGFGGNGHGKAVCGAGAPVEMPDFS